MTRSVMIQGTSSGAGKTMTTALLCRYFHSKGISVAPFKAQNLSLNSFVTSEGHEIGISQAFQAWACGIDPRSDMNPILLKPRAEGSCQIILEGRPFKDVRFGVDRKQGRDILLDAVSRAFDRLAAKHDVIIIEGSGSPAEINLREQDVANMATARRTNSPVILVGDIDKGGVFAGLYGTYHYLGEDQRYVKGFMINRFRGERSILASGIERMEAEMHCPCLGVLSYLNLKFPSEDSLDMSNGCGGEVEGSDVRQAWLSNLDRLLDTARSELDLEMVEQILDAGTDIDGR